jgi:hypothetical protein
MTIWVRLAKKHYLLHLWTPLVLLNLQNEKQNNKDGNTRYLIFVVFLLFHVVRLNLVCWNPAEGKTKKLSAENLSLTPLG